uniref:Zinc finger CCHC domain-containing protein 7 n=1 Tax=Leptobrachium leishanense TaxID=445787 RepID=A0A8C5LY41_9ANUR
MFCVDGDREAYEDELYREESSSEDSIDSEVEFNLYSQVHYSQNLSDFTAGEVDPDIGSIRTENKHQVTADCSVITVSDSDDIQVSDNSDVIILSDTLEEDSVYTCKAQRKGAPVQRKGVLYKSGIQSTPKENKTCHPRSKTGQLNVSRNYKHGVVQEVLVISGSSEDYDDREFVEALSTESESDQSDVENWMLLGGAKEDGDTSIQLNVGGGRSPFRTGEGRVDWSISERDSEKLPVCCLCGQRGHLQNTCPARYCSNCFQPGHFYRECLERAYWKKNCHRCTMTGHYADACPEIWRQYHLTIKPGPIKHSEFKPGQRKRTVYCCNCARKGHCNYECAEKTMYNGTFPSCQLIFTYDRENEVRKRDERAKNKSKELQEAGLLPYEIRGLDEDLDTPFSKKVKKRHFQESKAKPEEKPHSSTKKEKIKEKRHKKKSKLLQIQALEEDFPRGSLVTSAKTKKKAWRHKFDKDLFSDSKRIEPTGELLKKHKKKRHRRRAGRQSTVDETLLIIKQRKKKSKKNRN